MSFGKTAEIYVFSIAMGLSAALVFFVIITLTLGWWRNGYFKRRGVKGPFSCIPFIGHMLPVITRKTHLKDLVNELYEKYWDEKYVGLIHFGRPLVIVRDLELMKQMAIKDNDYFLSHLMSLDGDLDIVSGNNLFSLTGQKWKDMRATLSPAFSSAKMKGMFQFIMNCGEQTAEYLLKEHELSEDKDTDLIEIEMKEMFTRYANDVIATTAFGLEVNSLSDRNNDFYVNGKRITNVLGTKFFTFLFLTFAPRLAKLLHVKIFPDELINFYRRIVWATMEDRENRNVIRNDMIQILMEAKKGSLKYESSGDCKDTGFATVEESEIGKMKVNRVWSDDEILAQAILFFIAGFDAASTILCFLSYELAIHPEIQRRLQEEVDHVSANCDGKLSYECLQKMKYLDMVVSETIRLWPPPLNLDRKCTKSYILPPPKEGGKPLKLNVGDGVWFPIYSIHRDSQYYEDPEKFDPERFSDENKANIKPGSYLAFGLGPRNCIGSRFSLLETKAILYNILLKFDIVPSPKSQIPIKLRLDRFNLCAEKGFWLGLIPRVKNKQN